MKKLILLLPLLVGCEFITPETKEIRAEKKLNYLEERIKKYTDGPITCYSVTAYSSVSLSCVRNIK